MLPYIRNMTQQATYWAPAENDGFGSKTFAEPVVIACRWEDGGDLVRTSDGREISPTSTVYCDRVVELRGYLVAGSHPYVDDPTTIPGSGEIIQVTNTPNLKGTVNLTRASVDARN